MTATFMARGSMTGGRRDARTPECTCAGRPRAWPGTLLASGPWHVTQRIAACLAAVVLGGALGAAAPGAAAPPAGFEESVLASAFQTPTQVAWGPDGRMFVAEK